MAVMLEGPDDLQAVPLCEACQPHDDAEVESAACIGRCTPADAFADRPDAVARQRGIVGIGAQLMTIAAPHVQRLSKAVDMVRAFIAAHPEGSEYRLHAGAPLFFAMRSKSARLCATTWSML